MTDGQTETEGSLAYSELNRNAIRKLEQLGQPYTEKKQRYMVCQERPDTLIPISIITASELRISTSNFLKANTMIIKNLLAELELQLSDIAFSGLRNIQPVTLQKLEDLKHWMNELNMSEAIRLTDRFIDSVYAWQAGQTTLETVAANLCALEFYEKNIVNN